MIKVGVTVSAKNMTVVSVFLQVYFKLGHSKFHVYWPSALIFLSLARPMQMICDVCDKNYVKAVKDELLNRVKRTGVAKLV